MTHDRPPAKCRTNQSPFRWWNPCWNIPWRRSRLCPLICGQWQGGHVIHVIISCASGCCRCAVQIHNTLTTTTTSYVYYIYHLYMQDTTRILYTETSKTRCVLTVSFSCAFPIDTCSIHLSSCLFFLLSDTGSPCWDLPLLEKLRAYGEYIRPSWSLSCTACSHWYFSLSLCSSWEYHYQILWPSQSCRAIRWLEKTILYRPISIRSMLSPRLRLLLRIHPIHAARLNPLPPYFVWLPRCYLLAAVYHWYWLLLRFTFDSVFLLVVLFRGCQLRLFSCCDLFSLSPSFFAAGNFQKQKEKSCGY